MKGLGAVKNLLPRKGEHTGASVFKKRQKDVSSVKNTARKGTYRRKKRLSKQKLITLTAVFVLIAGGGTYCYTLFFGPDEAVALTDFTIEGSLTQAIEGTGTTVPADSVSYSPVSDTEILEVYVEAGDTVKVGDPLFAQDDSEVDEQVEEYEDEINDNKLDLEEYEDKLAELNEAMGNLVIAAPFSGTLTEVQVEAGDSVNSGTKLCVITDGSRMKLTQYFSYAYEGQVYAGMSAVLSVSAQMLTLDGKVTNISKVNYITEEGMSCFSVTVTVTNPGSLTEGLSAGSYLVASDGTEIYPAVEGQLEYANTKALSAEASGELLTCNAVNYQSVYAGQTLFSIDSDSYSAQIASVESQIEYLEEKIADLEADIEDAEESREDYAPTAEIAGTVISCSVTEGISRNVMMQSVTIYNLDTMTISVNIDELDEEDLYTGMEVRIVRSGSETDTYYDGYISYLSLEASSSNGVATFPCTITIESDGALTAGVNVSYVITTGDSDEGVLAPLATLKTTDEGSCLFVKSDSRPDNAFDLEGGVVPEGFYAVPVELGSMNSEYARILSGVEAGAEVFTRYQETAPSNGNSTSDSSEEETDGNFQVPGGDFVMPSGNMPGNMGGMP